MRQCAAAIHLPRLSRGWAASCCSPVDRWRLHMCARTRTAATPARPPPTQAAPQLLLPFVPTTPWFPSPPPRPSCSCSVRRQVRARGHHAGQGERAQAHGERAGHLLHRVHLPAAAGGKACQRAPLLLSLQAEGQHGTFACLLVQMALLAGPLAEWVPAPCPARLETACLLPCTPRARWAVLAARWACTLAVSGGPWAASRHCALNTIPAPRRAPLCRATILCTCGGSTACGCRWGTAHGHAPAVMSWLCAEACRPRRGTAAGFGAACWDLPCCRCSAVLAGCAAAAIRLNLSPLPGRPNHRRRWAAATSGATSSLELTLCGACWACPRRQQAK